MKVELSESMWTVVMDQLAEGSIKKCLPAMQAIGQQLAAQQQQVAHRRGRSRVLTPPPQQENSKPEKKGKT